MQQFSRICLQIAMSTERKTIFIDGMTCINCQYKIEKALKNTAGISSAHVSYGKGIATVEFDSEILSLNQITTIIQNLDYSVVKKRQPNFMKLASSLGTIACILSLYYLLQHFGILNLLVPSKLADSKMSYGMLFVVGLLTSVHCIAMCGGINLSQCIPTETSETDHKDISKVTILLPSFLYNSGRVVSYTVIGFLLGGIACVFTGSLSAGIPTAFQGVLKIIAGFFMVIMGINMLGIFPFLRRLQIRFPQKTIRKISEKKRTEKRPFVIGLLNGLMPCGPLQSMQIIALGSGNPVSGSLAMFMFSLGTVPLMMGLGSLVSVLGKKYTKMVMQVGCILVVVLGLAMFSQGVGLTGISLPEIQLQKNSPTSQEAELNMASVSETGDIQYVESNLDFGSYPEITVYSGIPVKWTIHVPEDVINGCNYKIIISAYGITHEFTAGDNVIEFVPKETGTVTYTCWMGMIDGVINIIK